YSTGGKHTITTTVAETGQAVDKIGDDDPDAKGKKYKDVLRFRGHDAGEEIASLAQAIGNPSRGQVNFVHSGPTYARTNSDAGTRLIDQLFSRDTSDRFAGADPESLVLSILGHERSKAGADWTIDSLFAELGS